MRSRLLRPALGLVPLCLVVSMLPAVTRAAERTESVDEIQRIGGLVLAGADAVADAVAETVRIGDHLRPAARGIRVALVSSGVDTSSLPEPVRGNVSGAFGDPVGYGTYAASVLLQLDPDAEITSLAVYANGRFDPRRQADAFDWVVQHTGELDSVLYAVPPHEFLDPVSASMASGDHTQLRTAIADHPLTSDATTVMGVALNDAARRKQFAGASAPDRKVADRFAYLVTRWQRAVKQVRALNAAGINVVSPAGDLGPKLQTILGFANLPEVVAVGGSNGSAVSPRSSSGPGLDGTVKPDLVAPTGLVGLLPERSSLAKALGKQDLLDAGLRPALEGTVPTDARARLDSSLTSAAIVAAATAGMAAEGLRDAARQRGALTAASVPLPRTHVWRQGAGVLQLVPDRAFAEARPLALAHGDLGAEPGSGTWTASVPFTSAPSAATSSTRSFVGVGAGGPDGWVAKTKTTDGEAPSPVASVTDRGVELSLPLGDSRYEGGLYCGYTEVSVPLTGGDARPGVTVDGIPSGTEQVPTCLVKGTRLDAYGFYIHAHNAEDLTFSLEPALPPEASLLHRPFMLLPVDPLKTRIYTKVTGADGHAYFNNIPPGYFTVKLFSDYGAPITSTRASSTDGSAVVRDEDIGENPSYQSFDALILSAEGVDEQTLKDAFGEGNVEFEKVHQCWIATLAAGRQQRFCFGKLKKMVGVAVSSRVIDLLGYEDLDFGVLPLGPVLEQSMLGKTLPDGQARGWIFGQGDDPDVVSATFNPLLAGSKQGETIGMGTYPFNLTTPNYKAHMSLNFSYDVANAFIVAIVQMGEEVAFGVVSPQGTFRSPTVGTDIPLGSNGIAVNGQAAGLANFEFEMKPHGAPSGQLTFLFVPSRPVQQLASPLARATIDDVSFELDTWQRVNWPPVMTPYGMGHSFDVNPRYSTRQMDRTACRPIDNGTVKAEICEDWTVMMHSPLDHASTVDLVDGTGSAVPAMRSAGSSFRNPRRGTKDFSSLLAVEIPNPGGLAKLGAVLPQPMRSNGRFWEQYSLPKAALASHPGRLEVLVKDVDPGRASPLLPHTDGGVVVPPYVPFANEAIVLGGNELALTDRDRDGVPQIAMAATAPSSADMVRRLVLVGDPDDADASVPGDAELEMVGVQQAGTLDPFCTVAPSAQASPIVLQPGGHDHEAVTQAAAQTGAVVAPPAPANKASANKASATAVKPIKPVIPRVKTGGKAGK